MQIILFLILIVIFYIISQIHIHNDMKLLYFKYPINTEYDDIIKDCLIYDIEQIDFKNNKMIIYFNNGFKIENFRVKLNSEWFTKCKIKNKHKEYNFINERPVRYTLSKLLKKIEKFDKNILNKIK